jgi:hypothetical protein
VSLRQFAVSAPLGWLSVILLTLAARISFLSASISAAEYAAWAFLLCVPAAIAFILGRNRPSASVAQVIYDAENARPHDRR